MRVGFMITDYQDFFLYSSLIGLYKSKGHEVFGFYDSKVNKRTSIRNNRHYLRIFDFNKIVRYTNAKEAIFKCKELGVDIVMTNEGMPFQGNASLPFDMYAFSWTLEHFHHGHRFLNICKYFFCEDPYVTNIFDFSKYTCKVITDHHPKYFCLHKKGRKKICRQLNICHKQKYVTVMGPAPGLMYERNISDIQKIVDFFRNRNYKIILKQKPKDNRIRFIKPDISMDHRHTKYSTSLFLCSISDYVVGFNTTGVIESMRVGVPYINLYIKHKKVNYKKHPQFKVNGPNILRIDNFDKGKLSKFISLAKPNVRNDFPICKELDL